MSRIQIRTAAVLKLMDRYTEKPVGPEEVQVQTRTAHHVIWKPKGCAVLLEQPGIKQDKEQLDILISGTGYQRRFLSIARQKEPVRQPAYIWLAPDGTYPFGPQTLFFQGSYSGKLLWIIRESKELPIRLLEDYEKRQRSMQLWGTGEESWGRDFLIAEDGREERFCLVGEHWGTEHGCRLENPLKNSYHRGKAQVYRLLKVEAGAGGQFFAGYRPLPGEGSRCRILLEDGSKEEAELFNSRPDGNF